MNATPPKVGTRPVVNQAVFCLSITLGATFGASWANAQVQLTMVAVPAEVASEQRLQATAQYALDQVSVARTAALLLANAASPSGSFADQEGHTQGPIFAGFADWQAAQQSLISDYSAFLNERVEMVSEIIEEENAEKSENFLELGSLYGPIVIDYDEVVSPPLFAIPVSRPSFPGLPTLDSGFFAASTTQP